MSVFLLSSALVTTLLIPAGDFRAEGQNGEPAGPANGRALAYLAHQFLGPAFGTVYDLSTIAILWFAGASAMAGLLNIVPRYLPRYGMAPEWTRATRPLVLVFTAIAFGVTMSFRANVDAQGGAYATGVLVLMTSAALAVTLAQWKSGAKGSAVAFALITLVFVYTTIANVIERPDGVKIASLFIAAIVVVSLVSRIMRTTELRVGEITLDALAQQFMEEAAQQGTPRIIANEPLRCDETEYGRREREQREDNGIPDNENVLFLEIYVSDSSEFSCDLSVTGTQVGPYRVLRAGSVAVPNGIAAFLLYVRDKTGKYPTPTSIGPKEIPALLNPLFAQRPRGCGARHREILRQAEAKPARRPRIHAGI